MDVIKVMVVDGYPAFQEGLCNRLQMDDTIKVIPGFKEPSDLLPLVRQSNPDVIFFDYGLCNDNFETVYRIKEICPRTAIIIVDLVPDEYHLIASLQAGAVSYVIKDADLSELANCVYAVRRGKDVFDLRTTGSILRRLAKNPWSVNTNDLLNERELEIVKLVALGLHNKEIAGQLALSERTIQSNLKIIFNKLGVATRTEAAMYALRKGWFSIEDLPYRE